VRLVNSREEEMLTCLFRENADIRIRSAVTKEGDIAGREAVVLMDCGAYGGEQVFRLEANLIAGSASGPLLPLFSTDGGFRRQNLALDAQTSALKRSFCCVISDLALADLDLCEAKPKFAPVGRSPASFVWRLWPCCGVTVAM